MVGESPNLSIESIHYALNEHLREDRTPFYADPRLNQLIEQATRQGYVRRISHTQAEWIEEGLIQLQAQERQKSNLRTVLIRALSAAIKALEVYQERPADRQCELGMQHCQEDIDAVWQAAEAYGIWLN